MQTFKQLLLQKFSQRCQLADINVLQFTEDQPQVYQQIHVDVLRSMNRIKEISEQYKIQIKTCQVLFEKFVMDSFCHLQNQQQQLYYQGLLDVFELSFAAFADYTKISSCQDWFQYQENNFKPFYGDISQFFQIDYEMLTIINLNLYSYLFKQTNFSIDVMNKQGIMTRNYINKYDSQLFEMIEIIPKNEFDTIMLKNQVSCCLHSTNSLEISFKLAELYLTSEIDKQSFIIQQLLSLACRKTTTIFCESKYDKLYKNIDVSCKQLRLSDDSLETAHIIMSDAMSQLLTPENAFVIQQYLDQVVQRYSSYKLQSNIVLATQIGVSVAALAVGLPGLIVGLSLAAFKAKRK
ncbi:Conserved_hypothetical protein [Hexamita inflata]|uniref:Transmembrane protein n=1 Tax=Hexamita inflata TaxID=28002 RepID=A0AA86PBL4_9EUKA|nr:Conserved hypothetical protein [Hexamita inflata]